MKYCIEDRGKRLAQQADQLTLQAATLEVRI